MWEKTPQPPPPPFWAFLCTLPSEVLSNKSIPQRVFGLDPSSPPPPPPLETHSIMGWLKNCDSLMRSDYTPLGCFWVIIR